MNSNQISPKEVQNRTKTDEASELLNMHETKAKFNRKLEPNSHHLLEINNKYCRCTDPKPSWVCLFKFWPVYPVCFMNELYLKLFASA